MDSSFYSQRPSQRFELVSDPSVSHFFLFSMLNTETVRIFVTSAVIFDQLIVLRMRILLDSIF